MFPNDGIRHLLHLIPDVQERRDAVRIMELPGVLLQVCDGGIVRPRAGERS